MGDVGSFSVYGTKLHMLCSTNRVPNSYELTPANVADIQYLKSEGLVTPKTGGLSVLPGVAVAGAGTFLMLTDAIFLRRSWTRR